MSYAASIVNSYDSVARWYDEWGWQTFWDQNEVPIVRTSISRLTAPQRAIDVGAGTGRYVSILRNDGYCAYGIDTSKEMLSIAASKLNNCKQLIHADACSTSFSGGFFDLAIAARVLCHVTDIEHFFFEIGRIVSSGGSLIVTELDHEHDFKMTRIPTRKGKIPIATRKRKALDIASVAECAGWRLYDLKRITAKECYWLPSSDKLTSIDRSATRPIFDVITFHRT